MSWLTNGVGGPASSYSGGSTAFSDALLNAIGGDFRTWGGNVDAATHNLSNLNVLTFATGGYVVGGLGIGASPVTGADLYLVSTGLNEHTSIAIQGQGGSLFWLTAQAASAGSRLLIGGVDATEPSTAPLVILSNGRVGLGGLLNPNFLVDIVKDNVSVGTAPWGDWQGNGTLALTALTDANRRLVLGYSWEDDAGVIQAFHASIGAKNLLLNPNGGKVSIGNASPGTGLDVAYVTASDPSLSTNTGVVSFANQTSTQLCIGGYTASGIVWIQTKYAGNDGRAFQLALNPLGGNVGIGTGVPTAKLHVVGLEAYANNAAALAANHGVGAFYIVSGSNPAQVAVVT